MSRNQKSTEEIKLILDSAMDALSAVPYKVSLRWLFYRLIELGYYSEKGDYRHFKDLQARYRKSQKRGWAPDTLVDDTRPVVYRGDGAEGEDEAIQLQVETLTATLSHFDEQKYYVEVWFEAEAMSRQFQYYTKGLTLRAFKGDFTIEPKWRTAKELEWSAKRYGLPMVIVYFGDLDDKGQLIPHSAVKDIRKWCEYEFHLVIGGLKPEHVDRFKLDPNPDRPGQFQWEALDDTEAQTVIRESISPFVDGDVISAMDERSRMITADIRGAIQQWHESR